MTSPQTPTYNCIAHAAGDQERWWDCPGFPVPGYYWPPSVRSGGESSVLEECFKSLGYERCAGGDLEDGFEKVALYVDGDLEWTHAAKQESNGEWSSKLGKSFDIRHSSPHCFGGSEYGRVLYFMRRPRSASDA